MNMCSNLSKMNYIKVWAQQTDSDIFVFSETWLSIKDKKSAFRLKLFVKSYPFLSLPQYPRQNVLNSWMRFFVRGKKNTEKVVIVFYPSTSVHTGAINYLFDLIEIKSQFKSN